MKLGLTMLGGAAALFLGAGCGGDSAEQFRSGTTRSELVKLNVPGAAASSSSVTGGNHPGLGTGRSALQGDRAFTYDITRGVTVAVNGWTVAVLDLVKNITDHPATTVSADQAVWGPYTDALSPNTFRLTVKKASATAYAYVLEGKAKTAADSGYVAILTGTHTPKDSTHGAGSFTVDFSAAKTLPENDGNSGSIAFTYSKLDESAEATVDVSFNGFHDRNAPATQVTNAQYHYDATPGAGGEFSFHALGDLDSDPSRPALEDLTIQSRWLETGAGRSDLNAEGGDLATKATVSECWDTSFKSSFLDVSFDPTKNYGSAATDCATFVTAKFPQG